MNLIPDKKSPCIKDITIESGTNKLTIFFDETVEHHRGNNPTAGESISENDVGISIISETNSENLKISKSITVLFDGDKIVLRDILDAEAGARPTGLELLEIEFNSSSFYDLSSNSLCNSLPGSISVPRLTQVPQVLFNKLSLSLGEPIFGAVEEENKWIDILEIEFTAKPTNPSGGAGTITLELTSSKNSVGLSSYQQGSFQSTTGQAALCYTEGPYENLCKPSSSTSVRIQISDANWRNKHYIVVSALAEKPVLMEGRHRSSISISIESNDSLYQALTFNQIALIIAEPEPDSTVPPKMTEAIFNQVGMP